MTMLDQIHPHSFPLPITQEALRTAQQFAGEQPTPEKAEQVRLNTLAVAVVNDYLQLMEIPTNLAASDSWNPIMRLCADVADLNVPNVGQLECRPLRSPQSTCYVPPEVWHDRVGYVVVQIDESLREAAILGFTPTVTAEELPLEQLQPPETILEYLGQSSLLENIPEQLVNLSQWFGNVFEQGWQTVDAVLNPSRLTPGYAFRTRIPRSSSVQRARRIDLGIQADGHPVALIVTIEPEDDQQTGIRLEIHPAGDRPYLPPQLRLIVLEQSGTVFLEAISRDNDNYIQLAFSGTKGERFQVQITLENSSVNEEFVI
jgi:hypothetical protein